MSLHFICGHSSILLEVMVHLQCLLVVYPHFPVLLLYTFLELNYLFPLQLRRPFCLLVENSQQMMSNLFSNYSDKS